MRKMPSVGNGRTDRPARLHATGSPAATGGDVRPVSRGGSLLLIACLSGPPIVAWWREEVAQVMPWDWISRAKRWRSTRRSGNKRKPCRGRQVVGQNVGGIALGEHDNTLPRTGPLLPSAQPRFATCARRRRPRREPRRSAFLYVLDRVHHRVKRCLERAVRRLKTDDHLVSSGRLIPGDVFATALITQRSQVQILPPLPTRSSRFSGGLVHVWGLARLLYAGLTFLAFAVPVVPGRLVYVS
jgi:hypothetical protein